MQGAMTLTTARRARGSGRAASRWLGVALLVLGAGRAAAQPGGAAGPPTGAELRLASGVAEFLHDHQVIATIT